MDSYSSSAEVNTNITENNERKDLGQEFLSQTANGPKIVCSVDNINQSCYNQSFIPFGQPFVSSEGFISMFMSKDIRLDINSNRSFCVTTTHLKASVDQMSNNIGLISPFARVYKDFDRNSVHIECGKHLAKMCDRGVTFTSLNRSLIYLVDTSGCKTTTERFRKLSYDYTADIFHANSLSGDYARQRAFADILRHTSETSENGLIKTWNVAGFKIRYNSVAEDLSITRCQNLSLKLFKNKTQLNIITPNLRIIATNSAENCLKVIRPDNRNEQRVVATFSRFQVKNGSQKAGFDAKDQLILM